MRISTLSALLLFALFSSLDAQAHGDRRRNSNSFEVSTNFGSALNFVPTLYGGFNFGKNTSAGLTIGYIGTPYTTTITNMNGTQEQTRGNFSGVLIAPEFRFYFAPSRQGHDGMYMGVYLRYRNASIPDDALVDMRFDNQGNFEFVTYGASYSTLAPGLLGGYVYQFKNGLQLSGFAGLGYAVSKEIAYTRDDVDGGFFDTALRIGLTIDFRAGVCVGYRF